MRCYGCVHACGSSPVPKGRDGRDESLFGMSLPRSRYSGRPPRQRRTRAQAGRLRSPGVRRRSSVASRGSRSIGCRQSGGACLCTQYLPSSQRPDDEIVLIEPEKCFRTALAGNGRAASSTIAPASSRSRKRESLARRRRAMAFKGSREPLRPQCDRFAIGSRSPTQRPRND